MESNRASKFKHVRTVLRAEEVSRRLAQWKLEEEDALDAGTPHAPSPTSTPVTKPAEEEPADPKAKGFGAEIGNTTATDSFDALGGRYCNGKAVEPATKPAGSADPEVIVYRGEIRKTTLAAETFDEIFGHSSNEKTVDPAAKPAGPADPEVDVIHTEIHQTTLTLTEILDELFGHSSNEKTIDPATKPAGLADPNELFGHSSNEKTVDPATKPAGPADPNAEGLFGETDETEDFDESDQTEDFDESDQTEDFDEFIVIIEDLDEITIIIESKDHDLIE